MVTPNENHYRPVSRSLAVFVGVVCALCGAGLAVAGVTGFFAIQGRHSGSVTPTGMFVFAVVVCALAALLLVFAWRLILNRGRSADGGLLSPLGSPKGSFTS